MGGQRREGRKKRSRIRTAESSHRFDIDNIFINFIYYKE